MEREHSLRIAHLFPDLLNLYGDRGNMLCLQRRCQWRGIDAQVTEYAIGDDISLDDTDILFLGGGSDREQVIVTKRLLQMREEIRRYVEDGGVLVAICGGYQLIGRYYQLKDERIDGLSLIDAYTEAKDGRLIGNVVIDAQIESEQRAVVGFENHAGRTFIGAHEPLGRVLSGYGNNGEDGTEGVRYKNVIGTYLHGPLLPKNPSLADDILRRAMARRYPDGFAFPALDDGEENRANDYIVARFAGGEK